MLMPRLYPILIILGLELFNYFWTSSITEDLDILYSLLARYSARISFVLLCLLGTWIAGIGLNNIFLNPSKRSLLLGGITAFTINHLIHYYFLYQNFQVSGLDISSKYISFGALGYLILTIAPIVLWRWKSLTLTRYYTINAFVISMISICIFTYFSRFGRELPLSTPMWLFSVMIGSGILVITLMIGRIIKERKTIRDEMA